MHLNNLNAPVLNVLTSELLVICGVCFGAEAAVEESEELQNFRPPTVIVLFCTRRTACHGGGENLSMYGACG